MAATAISLARVQHHLQTHRTEVVPTGLRNKVELLYKRSLFRHFLFFIFLLKLRRNAELKQAHYFFFVSAASALGEIPL